MKKIIILVVSIILLLFTILFYYLIKWSVSASDNSLYPKRHVVAEMPYGYCLYKYQDGENIVYIYERSGGTASISVITPCSK